MIFSAGGRFRFLSVTVLFVAMLPKDIESSCATHGNVMLLRPSGASARTARSDGLSVTGVTASQMMVATDKQRLQQYKYCFDTVGPELGIHPALIAAIVSRESRAGNALDSRGYGDNGNGYGLMQCDIRHSGLNCVAHAPYSCDHIRQLSSALLVPYIQSVARAHPSWSKEQQLQGGVAAYNFGVRNVKTWERLDVGSTGNDYSNDVIARAQHLISEFEWGCPGIAASVGEPDFSLINQRDARSYLDRYGYLENNGRRLSLSDGLEVFQRRHKLNVNGEIDEATSVLMRKPRCQNKDILSEQEELGRRKRYAVYGTRWPRNNLTYFISNYPPEMRPEDVVTEIQRAFKLWSDATPLSFIRSTSSSANIVIKFVEGDHRDGLPFDGTGGVLAHAFYPRDRVEIAGDAHFDDSETWTLRNAAGVNLFQVAVHEFGHSLGLKHSDIEEAVMYEFSKEYTPNLRLHADDIRGIQSLYGPPVRPQSPCKLMADAGNCEFYRTCVQAKIQSCDETKDYPIAYGYKYCRKFDEFYDQFTNEGQLWIDEVRKCLMNALLGYIYRPKISCQSIAEIAFDSHVTCYLNSGPGFCDIILDNMDALCNVYETGDFFGTHWKQAWKQVILTLQRCYSKWWDDQNLIEFAQTDWRLGRAMDRCAANKLGNYVKEAWSNSFNWIRDTWRNLFEEDSSELDCRFWEVFEYKFSCYRQFDWSFSFSFLLPLCVKFQRYSSIGPASRIGAWMARTQQCLINDVLPLYRSDNVNCMDVDTTLLYNMRSCMADAGFCEFDRTDEFFLDRAIDTKGFPAQLPTEYTTRPLSGKTERLQPDYFLKLRWFKSLFEDVNIMCYQRGERSSPYLYAQVENSPYGIPVRRRTDEL